LLSRYSVVTFQTFSNERVPYKKAEYRAEARGGGVCFVPVDSRADWPEVLDRILHQHFKHPLGRSVEVGVASLDAEQLATICRREGDAFWQGGDS
jgi:hypothetical protein